MSGYATMTQRCKRSHQTTCAPLNVIALVLMYRRINAMPMVAVSVTNEVEKATQVAVKLLADRFAEAEDDAVTAVKASSDFASSAVAYSESPDPRLEPGVVEDGSGGASRTAEPSPDPRLEPGVVAAGAAGACKHL